MWSSQKDDAHSVSLYLPDMLEGAVFRRGKSGFRNQAAETMGNKNNFSIFRFGIFAKSDKSTDHIICMIGDAIHRSLTPPVHNVSIIPKTNYTRVWYPLFQP